MSVRYQILYQQIIPMVIRKNLSFFFLILALLAPLSLTTDILDPEKLYTLQFSEQISGIPEVFIPTDKRFSEQGKLLQETYEITMKKATQKMLPGNFPQTQIYAYGGSTNKGNVMSFPGPVLMAKQGVPIKVIWKNEINGEHMLPVDLSEPFNSSAIFAKQVPVVPHAHGLVTPTSSDGAPMAYWTASGVRSPTYQTEQACEKNEAVYVYTNEQQPGLYWYHDHAYGVTRLNVYAGLAGFYKIVDNPDNGISFAQKKISEAFGENIEQRYFAVADRSFKNNGQLHYPDKAYSQKFTSWVPEFFGNTITVNGKVWPKVVLEKKKYRLIFLNACQCRFLNIYFLNSNKKLPFQLIRVEGDYYPTTIVATQYFLSLGARLQILLDLSQINGEVIMKNNAAAPHPDGDPDLLIDHLTGTIMKIQISRNTYLQRLFSLGYNKIENQPVRLKQNLQYPTYSEGEKIFTSLIEFEGEDLESVGMMIDGIPMEMSAQCEGPRVTFQIGKVYDFYIINLTPDTHPMHFHLINMQKVMSFPIDVDSYIEDWYKINGQPTDRGFDKHPEMLDPELYRVGNTILPKAWQKVFRDVVDAPPDMVTVVRIKFSHNNGEPFSFNPSGKRYVWHCHMLEHQDNEMMKYFCLK